MRNLEHHGYDRTASVTSQKMQYRLLLKICSKLAPIVHGVINFYHHFRTQPAGSHVLQICRTEACQAQDGRVLERHIHEKLGVD